MHKHITYTLIKIFSIIIVFSLAIKLQSCTKKYDVIYTSNGGGNVVDTGNQSLNNLPAPCTATLDVLSLTDIFNTTNSYTVQVTENTIANNNYTVTCTIASNNYFVFQFPSKPLTNGQYSSVSSVSSGGVAAGNVYVYYNDNGDMFTLFGNNDPIYVRIINGKLNVYMCNELLTDAGTNSYYATIRAQ